MISDILEPTHLIFILVVALIFLGPKRLPEAGRALGKSIRDFKGAVAGITEDTTIQIPPTPTASTQAPAPGAGVMFAPVPQADAPASSAVPLAGAPDTDPQTRGWVESSQHAE